MCYYKGRIRIEPDWNVNASSEEKDSQDDFIRIEPDWNVNT